MRYLLKFTIIKRRFSLYRSIVYGGGIQIKQKGESFQPSIL